MRDGVKVFKSIVDELFINQKCTPKTSREGIVLKLLRTDYSDELKDLDNDEIAYILEITPEKVRKISDGVVGIKGKLTHPSIALKARTLLEYASEKTLSEFNELSTSGNLQSY